MTDVQRAGLDDYERGYLDGLWAYGWWKSGTCYVGTTGRTYKYAVEKFLAERGKEGWSVRFDEKETAS